MRGLYLITNDDPIQLLLEKLAVALATGQIAILQYRRKNVAKIDQPIEVEQIKAGHILRVDLVEGKLENRTTGQTFTIQPLPGFIREIAQAGGLVNYVTGENK